MGRELVGIQVDKYIQEAGMKAEGTDSVLLCKLTDRDLWVVGKMVEEKEKAIYKLIS